MTIISCQQNPVLQRKQFLRLKLSYYSTALVRESINDTALCNRHLKRPAHSLGVSIHLYLMISTKIPNVLD